MGEGKGGVGRELGTWMAVFSQTFLPLINFGDRLFQSRLFKDLKTVQKPIEANGNLSIGTDRLGTRPLAPSAQDRDLRGR